jgi:hypothetical protein
MYETYRSGSASGYPGYTPAGRDALGAPDVGEQPLRQRSRAWVWVVVLPPLTGLLAWLLADALDGWLWGGLAIAGGVILGLVVFGALSATVKRQHGTPTLKQWGYIGLAVLLWGVWTGVGAVFQRSKVYVDNFSSRDVKLEVNGQPWLEVKAGTQVEARLPRRPATIVTRDAATGEELDRRTVTVEPSAYIFNVLGAGVYERGSQEYGDLAIGFGPGGSSSEVHDVWIKADVDYLFTEPPGSIEVSEGTHFASRSYLKRVGANEVKKDD